MSSEPKVLNLGSSSSMLDKVDMSTVIHAAIIVVVAIVVYHLLFHR